MTLLIYLINDAKNISKLVTQILNLRIYLI